MAKEDFRKFMARDVVFQYPRLNQTYKFNTSEKKSEPCSPSAGGAAYSVAFQMNKQAAVSFFNELKAHYQQRKSSPEFSKVFGMRKLDDGTVEFRAKRNGTNSDGKLNNPPEVIDGKRKPLADTAIWGGSRGNIRVTAYPATDPQGFGGISLLIDTVQVTHAVYGGNNLDDFEETDTTIEGVVQTSEQAAAAPAPADDPFADISSVNLSISDEIPF